MKRYISSILLVLITSSCTVVTTQEPYINVEYYFGIPFITFSEEAGLQYNSIESFGLSMSNHGANLGYSKRQQFLQSDPEKCSAILFIPSNNDLKEFIDTLNKANVDLDKLCIYEE